MNQEFAPSGPTVNKEYNLNAICMKQPVKNDGFVDNQFMAFTCHCYFVNLGPKHYSSETNSAPRLF